MGGERSTGRSGAGTARPSRRPCPYANAGSFPFADFHAQLGKQRLDVPPRYVRADGMAEDQGECSSMFALTSSVRRGRCGSWSGRPCGPDRAPDRRDVPQAGCTRRRSSRPSSRASRTHRRADPATSCAGGIVCSRPLARFRPRDATLPHAQRPKASGSSAQPRRARMPELNGSP